MSKLPENFIVIVAKGKPMKAVEAKPLDVDEYVKSGAGRNFSANPSEYDVVSYREFLNHFWEGVDPNHH